MSEKNLQIINEVQTVSSTKLSKNFNLFSLLGIAFSLTNSWLGVSSALVVGLYSGGPLLIIYGLIIGCFFTVFCAWSLSEFVSWLPNSSGAYFWCLKMLQVSKTNDTKFDDSLEIDYDNEEYELEQYCCAKDIEITSIPQYYISLFAGLLNYCGAIFTTASVCSSLSYSIIGLYQFNNLEYELKHWHLFVCYEALNIFFTFFNCYAGWLPFISQLGLYMSLFTYTVTFVVSLVCRADSTTPWPKASSIFKDFDNTTGWNSSGMGFIVGLINPLWAFAGIDSAIHMVDEVGYINSRKFVPKAIIFTVVIGFITSFTYSIGLFYCIKDKDTVVNSILPILEIYYQATGLKKLSIFFQACSITCGCICGISSGTWQSRILWGIGNDIGSNGSLFWQKISEIDKRGKVPLYSHLFSQIWVAIIGCIFMGSSTAFNAIITACIALLLLSYAVPCVILLFVVGRKKFFAKIQKEMRIREIQTGNIWQPFLKKWSNTFGFISNIITILWSLFCLIFLSFPYQLPVNSSNMNYVTVVYFAVFIIVGITVFFTTKTFNKKRMSKLI